MRKLIIALLLSAAWAPLRAAEAADAAALSLDHALSQARESNPEMRKLRLAADAASWKAQESLSAYVPHLDLRGTHYLGAEYGKLNVVFGGASVAFPEAFAQTEADLNVTWLVFDGFAAWGGYRASSLEAEAAELEARHALSHLEQAVRVRFYKALAAQELVKVTDQNITTLEDHAALADASEKAGFGTRVDVLRIASQLEEARAEKLLAQDNAALALRDLDQAMGVAPDERALDGSLPVPDAAAIPAGLSLDTAQRADFQAIQRREDSLSSLQNAANAGLWAPKLSLFGGEQFYKFGDFDPAILPSKDFDSSYGYGLRLSWNLFNGGADWAKAQQAKDSLAQLAESRRRLVMASGDEFESAKRHYLYNAALYQARLRSVEKSKESVRLALLGVKAGAQTQAQALDAELDLFRASAGVIRAQVDAAEALATLEQALGHSL